MKNPSSIPERGLTTSEASERMGIPSAAVRDLIEKGVLQNAYKVNGRWRVPVASVEDWLENVPAPNSKYFIEKNSNKSSLQNLALWATVVTALITAIALAPGFYDLGVKIVEKFQSPAKRLVIETTEFYFSPGFVLLPAVDPTSWDPNEIHQIVSPCLGESETCKVIPYLNYINNAKPQVNLTVRNTGTATSLVIDGIDLQLINFKEIGNDGIDLLIYPGCGGGGSYHTFVIDEFPQENPAITRSLPTNYQVINSNTMVGKTARAEMVCQEDNCDEYLYLDPQEVEALELQLPFFNDLLPGWYEFELNLQFSQDGEKFTAESTQVFNLVIPEQTRIWWSICAERFRGFADLNFHKGEVSSNLPTEPQNNPPGKLIVRSFQSIDESFFTLDLQSGEILHVGNLDWQKYNLLTSVPSPNGHYIPVGPIGHTTEDLNSSSGLGILHIESGNVINIISGNSNYDIHLHPAWSPSGNKLAFVTFAKRDSEQFSAGQSDIFVFDLDKNTLIRATFTPDQIEMHPVWIDEHRIAFIVPGSQSWQGWTNDNQGIGLVDSRTGESTMLAAFRASEWDSLAFFGEQQLLTYRPNDASAPGSKAVAIILDSKSILDVPSPQGYDCWFLNAGSFSQLCLSSVKEHLLLYTGFPSSASAIEIEYSFHNNRIGNVIPEGFFVADLDNGLIRQYDNKGILVQRWEAPQLKNLLRFSSQDAPTLVVEP